MLTAAGAGCFAAVERVRRSVGRRRRRIGEFDFVFIIIRYDAIGNRQAANFFCQGNDVAALFLIGFRSGDLLLQGGFCRGAAFRVAKAL